MRIGVIGGGVVGRATARCWLEHCDEVRVYDIDPRRRTHSSTEAVCCDVVFVCLPEAEVDGFFEDQAVKREDHWVLRSTVPIGTTRQLAKKHGLLNLVHSPEFLTARCAVTDIQVPARNIIGCPDGHAAVGYTYRCYDALYTLYEGRFPGVPIHSMSSDESEAVKLFTNAFFAAKTSLFNELRSLVDKLSLDWDAVLQGVLSDGRIAHSHTQVPGPDGKRGFGGACLPKDLDQLRACFHAAEVPCPVLRAASDRNMVYDRKGEL